jgi:hypothetical protein
VAPIPRAASAATVVDGIARPTRNPEVLPATNITTNSKRCSARGGHMANHALCPQRVQDDSYSRNGLRIRSPSILPHFGRSGRITNARIGGTL